MDFNCFAWSFRNASWTFFSLVATILGTTILPWSFIGDILIFVGFDSANMTYARLFSFFADLKSSFRELKFSCLPLTPKCAHIVQGDTGSQLPSLFCNYFIIRCWNLREPLQDLRARDFQWLSDFFSPNICVAKFRSILFLFLFTTASSYQAFFVCRQRQTWIYPIKCHRYN